MLKHLRAPKTTCLKSVYERFKKEDPRNYLKFIRGEDIKGIDIVVRDIKTEDGKRRVLAECDDGCKKDCYLEFAPTYNPTIKIGEKYRISGSSFFILEEEKILLTGARLQVQL